MRGGWQRTLLGAAALAACTVPAEQDDTTIAVDCQGMSFVPSSFNMMRTARMALDVPTQTMVERCVLATSKVLPDPGNVELVAGERVFELSEEGSNVANLQITASGTTWVSNGGGLRLTDYDYSKASGTYEADVTSYDLTSREYTGEFATATGRVSWCGIGDRADCPDVFAESLPDAFVMDLPFFDTLAVGKSSACRMLVDPTTEALQVDFQAAIWNGQNVGQLWVNECGNGGVVPPRPNQLVFRAGGVGGPGTYGPQRARLVDGDVQLPELVYTHPLTFYPGINATQACSMYGLDTAAELLEGGTCTFVVDADAQRFVLDCDEVRHESPSSVLTIRATGDLHFEADCLYLEQPS